MTRNFLAITAMTLSLASTSALAQTAGTTGTTGATDTTGTAGMTSADQGGMPMEWDGAIGDAFYSDAETGTLRDADEMRSNWDGLSEDDQAVVRDYCEDFDTDSAQAEGADAQADTSAQAETATTQEGGTGQVEEPGAAGTQSGVATTDTHQASIAQVCDMIDEDAS